MIGSDAYLPLAKAEPLLLAITLGWQFVCDQGFDFLALMQKTDIISSNWIS